MKSIVTPDDAIEASLLVGCGFCLCMAVFHLWQFFKLLLLFFVGAL